MNTTQIEPRGASCCAPASANNPAVTQTEKVSTFLPVVDVMETADEYRVIVDVPGAKAEDIDVQFERGLLTIEARVATRRNEAKRFLLREYGVGDLRRTFRIGDGIAAERISAQVADGVLTLHLPKTEALKPHRIGVKVA
jgi:HSP20 family protein